MTATIPFRVTQASLNQTAFDFPRNLKNIYEAIDHAAAQGSDLLALEELALTGYDAGDDFQKTDNDQIVGFLQDIARYAYAKNPQLIISIGHPYFLAAKDIGGPEGSSERPKNTLFNRINLPFNVQSFIGEGRILGMTAKQYLFNYERGYEKRYFAEWSMTDADEAGGNFGTLPIKIPGQKEPVPFGRPIIQLQGDEGGVNLTHVICEEKWVASRYDDTSKTDNSYARDGVLPAIASRFGKQGLVAVMPNASPPTPLKIDKHLHLAKLASAYADAVVDTDGLGSSGSTFAQFGYRFAMQDGKLASYGDRLSFKRVAVTDSALTLTPAQKEASKIHAIVPHRFSRAAIPAQTNVAPKGWDNPQNPGRSVEELVRMNALWLFDYMRKSKTQGIVEALSGGADSAYNSLLVAVMVRLAVNELGVDGFCREMKHLRYIGDIERAAAISGPEAAIEMCLSHMLTTIYLGTDNNPQSAQDAARLLIEGGGYKGNFLPGIGGVFKQRNIQDIFNFYAMIYAVENTGAIDPVRKAALSADLSAFLHMRSGSIGRDEYRVKIDALKAVYPEISDTMISAANPAHGVAYENIQARARQVITMLVANTEGKMAIANPNLDEARNSYATFGGDLHSGTINLNGFLSKARELEVMQYMCAHGLEGIAPIRSLQPVLDNKPSAQLQPKDDKGEVVQNDEDALQRNLPQMNRLSQLMLEERAGEYGERRLHVGEIFKACAEDVLFRGVNTEKLYNMVRLSFERWWMGQHKIHASPISPTFGSNVDHQASLRTPNLSGRDRAELTQLGVQLLFKRARDELSMPLWSDDAEKAWQKRALMDEDFVDTFEGELKRGATEKLAFNLDALEQRVMNEGMAGVFPTKAPYYQLKVA